MRRVFTRPTWAPVASGLRTVTITPTANEDPLSYGGVIAKSGFTTGLDWSDMRSKSGLLYGKQRSQLPTQPDGSGANPGAGGYDDSMVVLSGFNTSRHKVRGKLSLTGSGATGSHELELYVASNISPNSLSLYECQLGYADNSGLFYTDIFKLSGTIGTFQTLTVEPSYALVNDVNTVGVAHGKWWECEWNNATITMRLESAVGSGVMTEIWHVTDSGTYFGAPFTGQPGFGHFWRGTEREDDHGFQQIVAMDTA